MEGGRVGQIVYMITVSSGADEEDRRQHQAGCHKEDKGLSKKRRTGPASVVDHSHIYCSILISPIPELCPGDLQRNRSRSRFFVLEDDYGLACVN
jgi:hypothetical protein